MSMHRSTEIRDRIGQVRASEQMLRAELSPARARLQALLADGTDIEGIAAAQARVSALAEALASRTETLRTLESDLAQAEAHERREAQLAKLADLATEATDVLSGIEADRAEAHAMLTRFVGRIIAAYDREALLRTEFLAISETMDSGVFADLRARGVSLDAIRAPWPGTDTAGARDLTLARLQPHGHAIEAAIAAVLARREEERRAELAQLRLRRGAAA